MQTSFLVLISLYASSFRMAYLIGDLKINCDVQVTFSNFPIQILRESYLFKVFVFIFFLTYIVIFKINIREFKSDVTITCAAKSGSWVMA